MKNKNKSKLIALLFNGHGYTLCSAEALAERHRETIDKGQIPKASVLVGLFSSFKDAHDCLERLFPLEDRKPENESRI